MKKIILTCQKTTVKGDNYAVYFHGWLMGKISFEFAEAIHQTGVNPLTVFVKVSDENLQFTVSTLTDQAYQEVAPIILDDNFQTFTLESSYQKEFKILAKEETTLTQKDLSAFFYQGDTRKLFKINILSSMAFKTMGDYYFLPDVRLFFQSLMKKYNAAFEGSEKIDVDLLNEIEKRTKLINYRINSKKYHIHKSYINGFTGSLTFLCKGNQTIQNYVYMLLKFGEYSGAGVKTSLGMGAFKISERSY